MAVLDQCEFIIFACLGIGGVVGAFIGAVITDELHKSLYGRKGRWR